MLQDRLDLSITDIEHVAFEDFILHEGVNGLSELTYYESYTHPDVGTVPLVCSQALIRREHRAD